MPRCWQQGRRGTGRRRGDCNDDGMLDISDAISTLGSLSVITKNLVLVAAERLTKVVNIALKPISWKYETSPKTQRREFGLLAILPVRTFATPPPSSPSSYSSARPNVSIPDPGSPDHRGRHPTSSRSRCGGVARRGHAGVGGGRARKFR